MSSATRPLTDSFSTYRLQPQPSGPILVASDTSSQSDAAFALAHALSERTQSRVQVVSAMRPFTMPMYAFDTMPVVFDQNDGAVRAARQAVVSAQRDRTIPDATWPVTVLTGDPAHEIVAHAHTLAARVIIVGRGRHALLQRALGGETVLRLLQLGDTPVLATEAKLTAPPKRVVIAADFSEFSLYAAQVALPLLDPHAHISLVHVAPPFVQTDPVLLERAIAYRNQAQHGFASLRAQLARESLTFEDVYVEGNPSDELLKLIRALDADLVVLATHGYGFLRRMILGSVAAELVRHAPCSVLCVPGSARTLLAARARPATSTHTRSLDMTVLDAELNAFTSRNAGRSCTVEIDRRDLGAQILGHGLPLVGASADLKSQQVTLMFGTSTLLGEHATHTIPDVTSIDVRTNSVGQEQVLRIAHADGQTLVLLD